MIRMVLAGENAVGGPDHFWIRSRIDLEQFVEVGHQQSLLRSGVA